MSNKIFKNNDIIVNQLRSKLLLKHFYNLPKVKVSKLSINLTKLKSFNDDIILEGLFLLEFIGFLKANIGHHKKMYQEVSLQLLSLLRNNNFLNFLLLLKLFYFPLLIRRNLSLVESFDTSNNYAFTLTNLNSFPFLPDVFFKWSHPINCFLHFDSKTVANSRLFLQYWNFPVYK